jgi:hypothetical protein
MMPKLGRLSRSDSTINLHGLPLGKVVHREVMAHPSCLDWHVALAAQRRSALS